MKALLIIDMQMEMQHRIEAGRDSLGIGLRDVDRCLDRDERSLIPSQLIWVRKSRSACVRPLSFANILTSVTVAVTAV